MRASNRGPYQEQRPGSHDGLCAQVVAARRFVAARALDQFNDTADQWLLAERAPLLCEVESPLPGPVFVDVRIDIFSGTEGHTVALVECKSRDEKWSAGDAIRQLKFYRQRCAEKRVALFLVFESRSLGEYQARLLAQCPNIVCVPTESLEFGAYRFKDCDEGEARNATRRLNRILEVDAGESAWEAWT